MEAGEDSWIRVLLSGEVVECSVGSVSGLRLLEAESRGTAGRLEVSALPTKAEICGGGISVGGEKFSSGEVLVIPDEPHIFSVDGRNYRGKLKLRLNSDGNSFSVINIVPVEPYLAGVVGAEMPSYWEPAALEAQAVAARTYCLYIKKRFGGGRGWDVQRTQASQVYNGVSSESAQVWRAVSKTWGRVLVCEGARGQEEIFPSYYSSTCGGHTEGSEGVFGKSCEALVGRVCSYCMYVAKPGIFYWATAEYDKKEVTRKLFERYPRLAVLGEVRDMVSGEESDYGGFRRLRSVKLVGAKGRQEILRAEDLRLTIDPTGRRIRSTAFKIVDRGDKWAFVSGRGYGHGVGMCQCGAEGMARSGRTVREILSYYYGGSRIKRIY
jgi:stage II sporulation protein D